MSYSEELEYLPALEDLSDSRSRSNRGKQRKGDALLQKKLADQVFVTKTLHDPSDTLSKRAKKRLEQENGPDDFQTGVPYSLNKQERWKTVNAASLLDSRNDCGPEVLVVNRVITSTHSRDVENLNVCSVHLDDNDELTKISVKGKGHKFSHFEAALKERRNVDKDETEPARILFNVVEPHPIASVLAGKTQRANGKGAWSSKSRYNDYHSDDDLNKVDSEDEEILHETQENSASPSSALTLGDFMTGSSSSQVPFRSRLKDSYSWSLVEAETEDPAKASLGNPVATPASSRVESVFEVIDISIRRWIKGISLQESISLLEHERVTIRWINAERVMVDASYLVKNSPQAPLNKPLLILFFEIRDNSRVLRVCVNANTRFVGANDREAFVFILKKQKDVISLFNTILEFVRDMLLQKPTPKVGRCTENPSYFAAEVNSEAFAVKAERCNEYDQMALLREMESVSDDESSETEKPSSTCHHCNSQTDDRFPTKDGSTCRECVAASVLRQLNRNNFPIDIPLLPSMSCSRIEFLYAVLPVPVMSKLIEASFLHFQGDNVILSACPLCGLQIKVTPVDEMTSRICPSCAAHWCLLCHSEPHWPMNCEQFEQWRDKWDRQYFVDKFCLAEDEELLRITCYCDQILILPSNSAHNTICGRCHCRYDKTGMACWDYQSWPYYPRLRKQRDLEGKPKDGYPVTVEKIAPIKLIAKEFASRCTEARNLRFNKEKRTDFEKRAMTAEKPELVHLRRTALVLVENCTAWLYLHRSEGATHRPHKLAVSHLLQQFLSVQEETDMHSASFNDKVEELRKSIQKVLDLFKTATRRSEE